MVSHHVNEIEGSTLRLKCLANAEPYPTVQWRKSDLSTAYVVDHWYGHIRTEQIDRTLHLIFQPLKLSDTGNYTCEASNKIGRIEHTVNVAVYKKTEYAPSIVTHQAKISADINSNATIICDVDGNPEPTVKWSKVGQDGALNDGETFRHEKIEGKRRYSLVINKVQQNNGGTFQCIASNKIGTVAKNIVLQVSSKYRVYWVRLRH